MVILRDKLGDSAQAFARIRRDVVAPDGTTYSSFRSSLKPFYGRVWFELIGGYVFMIAASGSFILIETNYPNSAFLLVVPMGLLLGYTIHFLSLFQHAAAHYNLAPNMLRNDRLSNAFLGILLASHIKAYRALHLQHHKWHGTTKDPENSYIEKPDLIYFVKWFCGIQTITKLLARPELEPGEDAYEHSYMVFRLIGLSIHALVVSIAAYFHYFAFALAWTLSIGIFFPLLSDLRVILEHRRIDADSNVDYRTTNHGAFTRMFQGGLFSHTFGGAGFNRHLLHHLDPSVPFERLGELDSFLRKTETSGLLESRTTKYHDVARDMLWR